MPEIIIGAHHISRGNHAIAPTVAKLIRDGKQLLCSFGTHGYGAYAYFADRIPKRHNKTPFVVFQIDSSKIRTCFGFGGLEYFVLPERDHAKLYVPIDIIGFVNLQGFVSCPGHLYNFK